MADELIFRGVAARIGLVLLVNFFMIWAPHRRLRVGLRVRQAHCPISRLRCSSYGIGRLQRRKELSSF